MEENKKIIEMSSVFENVLEKFDKNDKVTISHGFTNLQEIPIHIFKLDEFNILSSEINTLPDFLLYINSREKLLSKKQWATTP